MSFISKYLSHRYFLPVIICLFFVFAFLIYNIHIWSKTEYTDNANIEAEISHVSSEVSGVINEILVTENNKVKTEQIIAKILWI